MARRLTGKALLSKLVEQRDAREDLKATGGTAQELTALTIVQRAALDGYTVTVPAWALPSIIICSDDCPACCPDCGQGHGEDTLDCEHCRI